MVRRSLLFTPGDRPEMLRKAPVAGADVVVFDLEDAVSPGRKGDARETVRAVLTDPAFDPACEVCVRVNPDGAGLADDLEEVVGAGDGVDGNDQTGNHVPDALDAVMLPKVAAASDVDGLADRLSARDANVALLALVENSRGVLAADEIAAAPATDAVAFGAEDLVADLGATRTREGLEVLYARERVVTAATAHDCEAIDTLVTSFDDLDRVREDATRSVELGYDGKLAIHPAQVEPINEAFTPDPDEIDWAESVLAAKRAADEADRGVFEVDGEMIDAPLVARAERILERADAADRT